MAKSKGPDSGNKLKNPGRRRFLETALEGAGVAACVGAGLLDAGFDKGHNNPMPPKGQLKHYDDLKKIVKPGVAGSSFQSAPGPWHGRILSDYDDAIDRTRRGVENIIHGDLTDLPDHFDYKKQIDLVADELGSNIYRMSLDFGRLCPKEGEFNHELMAEYLRIIAYCRKRGVEPMVTLHHWPMPLSYCKKDPKTGKMIEGAWEHPDILKHFRFYIENIIQYFLHPEKIKAALSTDPDHNFSPENIDEVINNGLISDIITFNEPMMCRMGNLLGDFPPYQVGQLDKSRLVLDRVSEAHQFAYHEIRNAVAGSNATRNISHKVRLGIAYNYIKFAGDAPIPRWIAEILDQELNVRTIEKMERSGNTSDFMGAQYYSAFGTDLEDFARLAIQTMGGSWKPEGREYGDHPGFGYLDPNGMLEFLLKLEQKYPGKSKMVTEMGFADNQDKNRPFLIMEMVDKILEAIEKGVQIDAILLWSLCNNLEWTAGQGVGFGAYDKRADRLKTDNGHNISTRQVWTTLSRYLNNPCEETKRPVMELYQKAKAQYESKIIL